jgi:soluble lytic murein transglycosylase-like protein
VGRFRSLIEQAAQRHHLDAALLTAVVHVESGGNPQAVSPAGAQGLTQLIPATAQRFGVRDPFDPAQSLDGAAKYLRGLLGQFGGDVSKALAAYNAGEGNVKKYGGIPPFAETQAYVPAVLAAYDTYRQPQSASPGGTGPLRQGESQRPTGDGAAVESGGVLASTPSPLRLAWLLEAATFRPTRSRPEREA